MLAVVRGQISMLGGVMVRKKVAVSEKPVVAILIAYGCSEN